MLALLSLMPLSLQADDKALPYSTEVLSAYWRLEGLAGETIDPESATDILKRYALKDRKAAAAELSMLKKVAADKAVTPILEAAIAFADAMRAAPDAAYKLYKNLRIEKPDEEGGLAFQLLRVAREARLPEVEFDQALTWFENEEMRRFALISVQRLAIRGYPPAYRQLIHRYLTGDGAERSNWLAYYWLREAERRNIDVSGSYPGGSEALQAELSQQDREWLTLYQSEGSEPPAPHFEAKR
tara:strand:+ start:242 stop:967 length:726 start_codon:yes stop_codon:yes gene_type:complete